MHRAVTLFGATLAICLAAQVAEAAIITNVAVSGGDASVTNGPPSGAQRENDLAGTIVPFGEDVPAYLDRTHQHNGPRFSAAGTLSTAAGDPASGLPSYLVGGEYVSTMQSNRDNPAGFQINVTVNQPVTAYLLLDNRLGSAANTDPPTLGSGGVGLMAWVADDGWVQKITGYSPNGQPDYTAVDEGATITDFNTRSTNTTGLGTGPGNEIQNFYTVYTKTFPAGDILLKEQNGGGINMYALVVQPVPEPAGIAMLGGIAVLGLTRRRARA
jgi:hypothetical protein